MSNKHNRSHSAKKEYIRRRPDVRTQPVEVRDRCLKLGQVFGKLEELKRANGGVLPYGSQSLAISELEELGIILGTEAKTKRNKFDELWRKQYLPYREAYPESRPEEAFSPHSIGRPEGRDIPPEVTKLIGDLYKKADFESANYDGSLNAKGRPVGAKAILSGVLEVYPQYKGVVQIHDVYAAINDLNKHQRANILVARGHYKAFDDELPSRNSDIEGVFEQVQLDIRPLPTYVRWGTIICTPKAILIADRRSGEILAADVIPGKYADTDKEVHNQDFTAQAVRELLAIVILRYKRRFRTIYADNGSQFKASTLDPYLAYLHTPESEPTRTVNRRPGQPRGGGFIENLLGDLDRYLQKFAGTYHEKRESYRDVLKRIKQDTDKLPTFEVFAKDFHAHIAYVNSTHDESPDGLSRIERRKQGPDYSLPMPPMYNLLVFARSVQRKPVKVNNKGFQYDNKIWEPERDTPEVRAQWTKAALSTAKREILVVKFQNKTFVFIDFEGSGITWEPTLAKGKPRNTRDEDSQWNEAARQIILGENAVRKAELDQLLQETIGGPLIISPNGRNLISRQKIHGSSSNADAPSDPVDETSPAIGATPADAPVSGESPETGASGDSSAVTSGEQEQKASPSGAAKKPSGSKKGTKKSGNSQTAKPSTEQAKPEIASPDDIDEDDDFWLNY